MIGFENINSGETGLSVRAKLNNMLRSLISGDEGVNNVWNKLSDVSNDLKSQGQNGNDRYYELREQVLKSFDYTDSMCTDLKEYINGMSGGVSGFAEDTSYKPDFPVDVAATVIATQAGTYTNMRDSTGRAITITEDNALIIFYKGAGSNYWKYSTIVGITIREAIDGGGAKQ